MGTRETILAPVGQSGGVPRESECPVCQGRSSHRQKHNNRAIVARLARLVVCMATGCPIMELRRHQLWHLDQSAGQGACAGPSESCVPADRTHQPAQPRQPVCDAGGSHACESGSQSLAAPGTAVQRWWHAVGSAVGEETRNNARLRSGGRCLNPC